ncbi:hypothetical protein, partial [Puia sp.]|uniref:hypothetical protein n=1 Tax=Puia sp. TaxID=2045100 RepID=UPI002F3F9425
IGSWTYWEHKVTGVSSVVVSGGGNIDELRLYPSTAQMTTYTYQPLVGVTSQCDVASRLSNYGYDGFGRLSYVKDQDGNVVKRYCYNANGQTTNCQLPVTQPVIASNSTSKPIQITFATLNNGFTANFTVQPGASNSTLGNIPAGTYNVLMTPVNSSSSYPVVFTYNGSSQQYYATVEFGAQAVAAPVTIGLTPAP